MACELLESCQVRRQTVQVAIQDPEYADAIRSQLLMDGNHRVQLVEEPDMALGGVIVVDAMHWNRYPWLAQERERLVVLVRNRRDDLSRLWEAGVRHVVFHGDPPCTARVAVLGVELSLTSKRSRVSCVISLSRWAD
jgi:hypothetical protein